MTINSMLIDGRWLQASDGRKETISAPYDGSVVGEVPIASVKDADAAVTVASDRGRVPAATAPGDATPCGAG